MKLYTKKQITRTAFAGFSAWLCDITRTSQVLSLFFAVVAVGLIISVSAHFTTEKNKDE